MAQIRVLRLCINSLSILTLYNHETLYGSIF